MIDGIMPYQLEKGPLWSVVDSAAARDPEFLYDLLEQLRDRNRYVADLPIFASTTLDRKPNPKTGDPGSTTQMRRDHINKEWFGMVNPQGQWTKQTDADWDKYKNPSTGNWVNYWGDVEEIVRETFVRACEVALGLDHDEKLAAGTPASRCLPISCFLKCPTPWFEGWVTWRTWGTGRRAGEVVVHLLIPGEYGSQVLMQPASGHAGQPPQQYPASCAGANGMWLITHEHHTLDEGWVTTEPGEPGNIIYPGLGPIIKDSGKLLVLAPSEFDGGVAAKGRAYKQATG